MSHYDDILRSLHERCARFRHLGSVMPELYRQRQMLEDEVRKLEVKKLSEQADVDRLERRSLASYFYNVVGKLDTQLDKERREAYAARVKFDAAARELDAVSGEIAAYESELDSLSGCEEQYRAVLREKAEALKAAGGLDAERIMELESTLFSLQNRGRELSEAINAGSAAYGTACQVLSSLDSAEGWGTIDLFGGGLISDLAKHSHLDEAQAAVEHLQHQLRCFKTELSDVELNADMHVSIDGFLGFADFFFDGLFADWAVMDKISQSKMHVLDTRDQIDSLLGSLEYKLEQNDARLAETSAKLDELILKS